MFVVNNDDDVDGMQDAGVAMLRTFNYIAEEVDNQLAFDAILSVSQISATAYRQHFRHVRPAMSGNSALC